MGNKKSFLLLTLSAGLIFSTSPSLLPLSSPTYVINPVYAAESGSTSVEELANRLKALYGLLNTDEKAKVTAVSEALAELSNQDWTAVLGETLISTVDGKLGKDKTVELAKTIGSLVLSTNPDTLVADINQFRSDYADEFDQLFGKDLTVDQLLSFIAALEEKLTKDDKFLARELGKQSIDEVIKDAIDELTQSGSSFANLDGTLYKGIGIGLNDLVEIRTRLAKKIDPDNSAMSAVLQGIARAKQARIEYPDNISTSNIPVGQKIALNFSVQLAVGKLTVTPVVKFVSDNPSVATISGNELTAVSAGDATVRALVFNDITIATDTIKVVSGGESAPPAGGGGGGVTPPDQTPAEQVTVPVTEKKGTNENGQTTLTVLPDENALLNSAVGSDAPVVLLLTSKETADLATAVISVGTIQALAADNGENSTAFSTGSGTIEIKASELALALKTAINQGIDPANAQVQLILAKGTDEEKGTVASALGKDSAVLAAPLQPKLVVVSGEKKVEISQFTGYLGSSLTLEGTYPAAQLVGVEISGSTGGTAKANSVQTAASAAVKVTPVPTTIEVKDGKTTVHVLKKTDKAYTVVQTTKNFTDVSDQWFAADVKLLANKLLIQGRTPNTFVPQGTLTRAEFAALLVRALGLPEDTATAKQFTDVKGTDWYAGYLGAAFKAGLMNGYPDRSARPNAPVKREEAAKMIAKAYETAGKKISLTDEEKASQLAKFTDLTQVSAWARDYIAFAAKEGILKGDNGKINPKNNSTRAESAALLKRLLTALTFLSE
ncbi:exported hypothetical protein [[Clostridium] ultunense Esp]|nr:exported hypothetical protein [[Clostridium] ultunense Esp]